MQRDLEARSWAPGRGGPPADEAPFSFGAVTFAPDGTFTAEAKYGETTRAVSGRYTTGRGDA